MLTKTLNYPAGTTMPEHEDGRPRLSIMLRGGLYEESSQGTFAADAGGLVVKGAAAKHATHIRRDSAILSVALPDEAVYPKAWFWRGDAVACRLACQTFQAVVQSDDSALGETLTEIFALDVEGSDDVPPAWLQAVKSQLDESEQDETVQNLAARCGCHPVYLARRFRSFFGVSISEYQHWRRIQRATAQAGKRTNLAELALAAGYYDQSHMTRYFKRLLGTTPKKWFRIFHNPPTPTTAAVL